MTPDLIDARSAITLISFVTFIGILWWSFSARRKNGFDAAARIPLEEKDELIEIDDLIAEKAEEGHV